MKYKVFVEFNQSVDSERKPVGARCQNYNRYISENLF